MTGNERSKFGVIIRIVIRIKSKNVIVVLLFLLASMMGVGFASAQDYVASTGIPQFSSPTQADLGAVDASNGNLHISIPLHSYAQRGVGGTEAVTLDYDSNTWEVQNTGGNLYWGQANQYWFGGWRLAQSVAATWGLIPYGVNKNCTADTFWHDQNGTVHVFHLPTNPYGSGCSNSGDAFAIDSTGFHMYVTNAMSGNITYNVYSPDGALAWTSSPQTDPNGKLILTKDTNGNYYSADQTLFFAEGGFYDTLGREIVNSTNGTSCSNSGNVYCLSVPNSQGTTSVYRATIGEIPVKTNFGQSGIAECTNCSMEVVQSLELPDGSTYQFLYDCDSTTGNTACGSSGGQSAYYGGLVKATLPTGGQVAYGYQVFSDPYSNKSNWISWEEGSKGLIQFTPSVISSCSPTTVGCQQSTVVQTNINSTTYTFTQNNGVWPVQIVTKDLNGNLLSSVSRAWDFSQPCVTNYCYGASWIRLLSETVTIPTPTNSLTKKTAYSYDTVEQGNVTTLQEWGFYPSTFPSVADRTTYTTYLTTGINDINRPLSITLCNNVGSGAGCPGGGSMVKQTVFYYDSYGGSGLATVSGASHHDDTNFGANYLQRGNPTQISRWISGSNYWTNTKQYDTTGQVTQSADPANNITTYSHADSFYTDGGNGTTPTSYSPSQLTNAYLTRVTDAIGSQSKGYYWGSGETGIATDYNGATAYSHYQDVFDRQTEETDPEGWGLTVYSSPTQADIYTAVADTSPSTGCSSCQHSRTLLDSWGRTSDQILVNNPIGQVNVNNTYDSAGRLVTQSHPNTGSSDPNDVVESFGYDSAGRQLSVAHPDGQVQRNAFGASVTELGGVTSQQGSTSTYGYGFPEVGEDEAYMQRQQWTDGFGRIIEVDEPSTSSSTLGTATVYVGNGGGQESQTFNPCEPHASCPETAYNSGLVSLTVNGYTASASYGPIGQSGFTTASTVASTLATVFNSDPNSPVIASASNTTIILTAKGPGSSGNFAFTGSATFYNQSCPPYNPCFGGPVYAISPSSGSLSGGSGGVGSSPYYTNYTYDAANNLTSVVQGVQTRTFKYDGLGRKIYDSTPEGGVVTYTYTASGGAVCSGDPSKVCQRTDARGVVSYFTYDHANRLTGVSYSIPGGQGISSMPNVCTTVPNGTSASVCYYYDQGGAGAFGIGRLTEMEDRTGSESYSHNVAGRVTLLSKVISGQTYNVNFQYDQSGDVTQLTYPSGRTVYQSYNSIGQLCQISSSSPGCGGSGYFAGAFSYNSPGNPTTFTYGNGVVANIAYSAARMQVSSLSYALGSQTYLNLGYWYQENSPNCPNGAATNNGTIQCITDAIDTGRTVNYGYDSMLRLKSAKTNGDSSFPQWGLSETFDRYGNRLSQTVTAGSAPSSSLTFTNSGGGNSNQPLGYSFDASGNMTVEPLSPPNDMTYDGENRMTGFTGNGGTGAYTYDGNGLRVVKALQGGTTTVSIFVGSTVIAEYDNGAAPASPSREYIYNGAGGDTTGLLAMISSGVTTYYHQDHLSVRLTTNGSGTIVTQEGHFPFGELWYQSGSSNKWVFTSYDRDSESGFDYSLARYYDSRTGTFCSADPLAGSPGDPQSWNRYPYGRNDPIDVTDPSGKSWSSFLSGLIDFLSVLAAPPMGIFLTAEDFIEDGIGIRKGPPEMFWLGGGISLGASWNGTPLMQYGGLAGGIQDALGLPSMADVGGPISGFSSGTPVYCDQNVMAAMKLALTSADSKNLIDPIKDPTKMTEGGFPVYNMGDGVVRVGNQPTGTPLAKQIEYGPASGWDPTHGQSNAIAVFHTHPSPPGLPSSPGNTAVEGGGGDTGFAVTRGMDNYVISRFGLAVASKNGPKNPPKKGWNPWIVQGNGIDDWMKGLNKLCGR